MNSRVPLKTLVPLATLFAVLAGATLISAGITPARADTALALPSSSELTGYEIKTLVYDFATLEGKPNAYIYVECPEGKVVLGGGGSVRDSENHIMSDVVLAESTPIGDKGWSAAIVPGNGTPGLPGSGSFKVNAICAVVSE